jgi:hypothetical protein
MGNPQQSFSHLREMCSETGAKARRLQAVATTTYTHTIQAQNQDSNSKKTYFTG